MDLMPPGLPPKIPLFDGRTLQKVGWDVSRMLVPVIHSSAVTAW
jgi:hypothetical protein